MVKQSITLFFIVGIFSVLFFVLPVKAASEPKNILNYPPGSKLSFNGSLTAFSFAGPNTSANENHEEEEDKNEDENEHPPKPSLGEDKSKKSIGKFFPINSPKGLSQEISEHAVSAALYVDYGQAAFDASNLTTNLFLEVTPKQIASLVTAFGSSGSFTKIPECDGDGEFVPILTYYMGHPVGILLPATVLNSGGHVRAETSLSVSSFTVSEASIMKIVATIQRPITLSGNGFDFSSASGKFVLTKLGENGQDEGSFSGEVTTSVLGSPDYDQIFTFGDDSDSNFPLGKYSLSISFELGTQSCWSVSNCEDLTDNDSYDLSAIFFFNASFE